MTFPCPEDPQPPLRPLRGKGQEGRQSLTSRRPIPKGPRGLCEVPGHRCAGQPRNHSRYPLWQLCYVFRVQCMISFEKRLLCRKKKMGNHSVRGCLPGNCGQVFLKICPLLDFGQPQTSWLFTSLPSSLSLWISLACGFCSSDSPRRQLSIQHHPALYGMLSARRAMRSNSCVQPVAVAFLPYARHRFFRWGLRGVSLPSPLEDLPRADTPSACLAPNLLSSVSFSAKQ